jgi:hypothetical protein
MVKYPYFIKHIEMSDLYIYIIIYIYGYFIEMGDVNS